MLRPRLGHAAPTPHPRLAHVLGVLPLLTPPPSPLPCLPHPVIKASLAFFQDVPLRGRTVNAAAALAVAAPSPGYRDLAGAPPQVYPSLAVAVQPSPAGAEGSSRQRTPTSNGHSPVIAQAVATQSPLPQQGAISPQASVLAQQAPAGSQAARPNGSTPQQAKKAKPAANEGEQPGSPSLFVANDGAILLHQTGPLPAASLPAAAVSVQAAQAALQGAGSLLPQVG